MLSGVHVFRQTAHLYTYDLIYTFSLQKLHLSYQVLSAQITVLWLENNVISITYFAFFMILHKCFYTLIFISLQFEIGILYL